VVVGEDGFAARGERGSIIATEDGIAAGNGERGFIAGENVSGVKGERGTVIVGEGGGYAGGERGFVAIGEEAFAVGGERGVIVGINNETEWGEFEVFEGGEEYWKFVAGATTVMAIGAMFSSLPHEHEVVVVNTTPYYYYDYVYYEKVYDNGSVTYRVIRAPIGAVVSILPAGCTVVAIGGVAYHHWAREDIYYLRSGSTYTVVVKP
jgi:hypothetical protein